MFATSFVRRSLGVLALTLPLAAHAQETPLFTWSGRVDRAVRLTVQGSQVSNSAEQNMQTRGRFSDVRGLPREEGTVRVSTDRGRGTASVIQQPSASNGYTALIVIEDNDGGADNYRVTAYFMPSNARGAYGDRGRGRNADRNRDGIPDRMERRDDRRQGQSRGPMLNWSGDVDGEVQLVWRQNGVNQRVMSGAAPRVQNNRVTGEMSSSQYGQLNVSVREGRGRVEVIQQPSAQNRYTGIIRIVDPQAGYGHYVLDATWQ
ncbi:MAG: hypothetical protein JWM95_4675 [Gemmatimonadetes bacterium]|nr:hypothetical protein [Gemmatimonadota bacterium]